ncbi:hypothetical protein [Planctomicrobium piriforme]|uniref:Uncharacterized protein n=1 Tax=Planctomicrobium piriforme TaxID=1576369 RepID=A0A1I3S5P9_9PLAN|nr:hypothetical protein [Planctomicrobium piriforme]SFJ54163.1 hypothetical protein SAMN05421753_12332 [Planctomicrobium piriforme]
MHMLGSVLLGLCVFLAGFSVWLTTKTLAIRHTFQTAIESKQQKIEKQITDIADARRRVRELEEQRQRLVHAWGDVWAAPNSRVQPGGTGSIELGVGASSGLPAKAADGSEPGVFVFGENGAKSQYLGEFGVADIRPTQAIVSLTRRPYAQETAGWPQGMYHVRGTLPAHWLTTSAELQAHQVIADSRVVEQRQQLASLTEQIKSSQAALDQRMAELNGNADAPEDAASEVKDGLVLALQKEEAKRDAVLAEVDRLRRQMIETYDDVIKVLQENRTKVELLDERFLSPPPKSPAATTEKMIPPSPVRTANRKPM